MNASRPWRASRRGLLQRAGLLGAALLPWPSLGLTSGPSGGTALAAASPRTPLTFTAYRNGSRLGVHRIGFAEEGGRLTVDIEIAFDLSFTIVPLYRYRHRNREIWEDGRLLSMSTETDDNGTPYEVEAMRRGDRLLVDGAEGRLDLPGDMLTTSYWNEAAMARHEWLDTQRGSLARSEVTAKPPEAVVVDGRRVEATPYELAGDITCTLWYRDGRWVGLRFLGEDESVIQYVLEADGAAAQDRSG